MVTKDSILALGSKDKDSSDPPFLVSFLSPQWVIFCLVRGFGVAFLGVMSSLFGISFGIYCFSEVTSEQSLELA